MQEFEKSQEDNVTQKLLKCPKDGCDKVFTSVPGLRYHTKTHVEPDRRFICEKCDKSFKSANGLKYHRSKTKGCDLPVSGYQLEKSDKSSNSEGDTEDSATEDFTSQEMSADESHNYHQHLHMNDKNRENCDSVNLTETSDDLCAIKSKPLPLLLSTFSESTVVATPSTTSWALMDDGCTSDVNKLQQLAIIATGPESPLLKPETNLNHKRVCSDGSDPQVTSSSPCPTSTKEPCKESGTWSHTWPTTVWQCFMKGVQIQFPENTWQTAEELARIEQLRKSSSGKENSQDGYAAKGLRLVRMTKILEEDKDSSGKSWHLHLNMSPDLDNQSSLLAKCAPDHPFFVLEKGWSSYSPAVTVEHYGIPCRKLEEDDICLPPSHHDATFTHDVFETLQQSLDFTPSDSSAVLALSNMAKQRRDLEQENLERRNQENQAKKQNAIKTDSLKAKRPMNGFMLFAKKNRLEYTQMYPGKDNRAISVMLGDRWKKMKTEERKKICEKLIETMLVKFPFFHANLEYVYFHLVSTIFFG
ncbi:HBP1 [Acanthosepion pharaonis]|uniref:HMG box-containing protein 1 n=1 Tax=Acanthosepion pharaonis TaxID=158019 RepID=A0A812DDS6_ACAPH|nr:HBP1 [Sepia pharaonis]